MSDSPDKQRKAKVTVEHQGEAARLNRIWLEKKSALKDQGLGSQMAFGAKYGIGSQAAVGFFLSGKTPLSLNAAIGFAKGLGCKVGDFSPRLAALIETGQLVSGSDQVPDPRGKYVISDGGRKSFEAEPFFPADAGIDRWRLSLGDLEGSSYSPARVVELLAEMLANIPPEGRASAVELCKTLAMAPDSAIVRKNLAQALGPLPASAAQLPDVVYREAAYSVFNEALADGRTPIGFRDVVTKLRAQIDARAIELARLDARQAHKEAITP